MKKLNLSFEPALPRAEEEIIEMFKDSTSKILIKKGLLQAIIDNLPFNILVFNDKSTLTYVNMNFCNLVGYSMDELLGLNLSDFANIMLADKKDYDYTRYPKILSGETISNYTYVFKHKSGSSLKARYNSYPLRISLDTKPIGCLCIIDSLDKDILGER